MLKDKKRICVFCGSSLGNNKLIQKEVIKLAKKSDNIVAVKLHVHTNNKSALRAYEKAGMKRTPEYPYIYNLK